MNRYVLPTGLSDIAVGCHDIRYLGKLMQCVYVCIRQMETPVAKTKYGKRTFAYNAFRLWSALPCDIRTKVSVDSFKKSIKTLLFDGTYDLKKRAYISIKCELS